MKMSINRLVAGLAIALLLCCGHSVSVPQVRITGGDGRFRRLAGEHSLNAISTQENLTHFISLQISDCLS
jgi:hypothetical protein